MKIQFFYNFFCISLAKTNDQYFSQVDYTPRFMSKPSVKVVFISRTISKLSLCKEISSQHRGIVGSKWKFPLQELKIRKGTGRGRGRRSKREANSEDLEETENKDEQEEYYVDEGDFGFVEVGKQIVLEWGISSQGRERGWWERESEESGSAGLGWRLQSLPEGRGPTSCNLSIYWNVPSRRSSRKSSQK